MSRKVTLVLGTRPELIKLAPIITLLGPDTLVIHTGQHDHEQMSARIATTLGITLQHLTLRRDRAQGRGAQLGNMIAALDRHWRADPPTLVIVQGDTTSALAGALAANHADLPLVHVEAGLRSFDRAMPEEHNRVLIDHLADLCCAPTLLNTANLRAEAIPEHRILLTGNTIIEAVQAILPAPITRTHLLKGAPICAGHPAPTRKRRLSRDTRTAVDPTRNHRFPRHPALAPPHRTPNRRIRPRSPPCTPADHRTAQLP